MIGFDELTHFSKHQFFYMLSRNRTDSGVAPYVRATCNPDADSWVADFIKWWITPETGYPIPERSGVIRYMVRLNDEIIWGDSKEELAAQGYDAQDVKSVTFIASTLQDNQILMKMDPGYLANLKALPTVERERLLLGNWKIKAAAGLFFRRTQVGEMLEELPKDVISWCRGWDLAATSEDEDGDGEAATGILETGFQETDIAIPVFKSYDGDTAQVMGVPLNIGEIQEVFSIMQMNVEEATKAIEAAKSENMLIVIHACDSRAGVKKAAQKKAGNLSSTNGSTNDPAGGNEFVDHSTQDETPSEK